jgi:hypothetical protein
MVGHIDVCPPSDVWWYNHPIFLDRVGNGKRIRIGLRGQGAKNISFPWLLIFVA